MSQPNRQKKLDKMYSAIPELECKGFCESTCTTFPVSEGERKNYIETLGYDPLPNHTRETLANIEIEHLKSGKVPIAPCPQLKNGKCSIYPIRPMICRLFGTTKQLRCPFGCLPKKWVPDRDAKKMLNKIENI